MGLKILKIEELDSQQALLAYINNHHVGTLFAENNIWRFDYTLAWATSDTSFDLSPALPRLIDGKPGSIVDGSSVRPVQWYFDNLLPEEAMRTVLAKEAKMDEQDAFGLLSFYGKESAGSLTLLPEDVPVEAAGMRLLPPEELSARIKAMPNIPLNADSPKHMSLAGTQHKLAVIYKDGQLFEPDGPTASTHILKPQHPTKDTYPASVVNEYLAMRVAGEVGLPVPKVMRLFCPEPVYIIERFDRVPNAAGSVDRLHLIDACQLLNKDRRFKYLGARIETMLDMVRFMSVPAASRQWFFDWLVFNILIGNSDNHLKNISFMVGPTGVFISPCYDLLCTAAYDTKAVNQETYRWPATELAFKLNKADSTFKDVTRQSVIDAGKALGLGQSASQRRLDNLIRSVPAAVSKIAKEILAENSALPENIQWGLTYDSRMLGIIERLILPDTLKLVS